MARPLRALGLGVSAALVLLGGDGARADDCRVLRYKFQPDCYRPAGSDSTSDICVQSESIQRLDFGPQIAVWIESADHTQFVDTLMVTNMTAARGIGNRPGIWNFLSGPKFPYGRRQMVLPIWAHAHGVLYPQVTMLEADREDWLGWHEPYSSPDPYFCRPLQANEFQVDAITCPTRFNSEKGKLDPTAQSYYPPRNDLTTFIGSNGAGCASPPPAGAQDPCDPRRFAALNDLDAVATATPPYGQLYSGVWTIPPGFPAGDYVVRVEVNKEFDDNAAHAHPAFVDPMLAAWGQSNNFGQPSVVYEVPIRIDAPGPAVAISHIAGYSDWTGMDGTLIPADATISTSDPGSGEGRLLEITGPAGTGRVHVSVEQCSQIVCDPDTQKCNVCDPSQQQCTPVVCPPPQGPTAVAELEVVDTSITASSAEIRFLNASANGGPVLSYDIRYREGSTMTDDEFDQALQAGTIQPGIPGSPVSLIIQNLKPATSYVLGVRGVDTCFERSPLTLIAFSTTVMKFKQVTGCFIATAAYGSALEPGVSALRTARDRLRPTSPILAAATDLYYRSGPPAADLLRRSDTARAVVRRLLGPVTALAQAAQVGR